MALSSDEIVYFENLFQPDALRARFRVACELRFVLVMQRYKNTFWGSLNLLSNRKCLRSSTNYDNGKRHSKNEVERENIFDARSSGDFHFDVFGISISFQHAPLLYHVHGLSAISFRFHFSRKKVQVEEETRHDGIVCAGERASRYVSSCCCCPHPNRRNFAG